MFYPALVLLLYVCIEPSTAQPTATLVSMTSTEQCSSDYLLDGQDRTTITYEISGANANYQFVEVFGPKFHWLSNGMESGPCYLIGSNDSCDGQEQVDDCHCELVSSGVYRLTYIKTADIDDSNGTIYIKWPGSPILTLGRSHLPEVRASCQKDAAPASTSASDDCDYCCMGACKEGCCVVVIIVIIVVCSGGIGGVIYYFCCIKGNKKVSDGSTIFVSGMGSDVTEDHVVEHFSQIGEIKTAPKVWICKVKSTNLPTGEACVTFIEPGMARAAVTRFNGTRFKGKVIEVKLAQLGDHFSGGGGGGGGVTKDRVVQHDIIFVSGMGSGVTEDRVVKHFSQIGEIKTAPKVWIYKGDGTVTFDNPESAKAAIDRFHGTHFNGQNIKVELAQRENVIRELVELQDTIAVSNLGLDVTEDRVVQHFSQIGIIKTDERTHAPEVWICKDKNTGLPTGEAFVTFIDPGMARAAVARFDGKRFNGQVIKVKLAQLGDRFSGGGGGGGGMGKKDNNEDIELGDRKYKIGGGDGRGDGRGDDEPPPGGNKTATLEPLLGNH